MRKLIVISLLCIFGNGALGAEQEVLQAVLNSEFTLSVGDIQKIEELEKERCRTCYIIKVSGNSPLGDSYVKVRTTGGSDGRINVSLIERSR